MLQLNYLTIESAVANHGGAMGAETISKNGRNLKSQMSRGVTIYLIIAAIAVSATLTSCDLFENKENKAIDICKKAKIQSDATDMRSFLRTISMGTDATWLDFANMLASQQPNEKLSWSAQKTKEDGVYIVGFVDEQGWGYRWEVTLDHEIVRSVNGNAYLSRKYGISRFDKDSNFEITDITADTLKLERKYSYSSDNTMEIVYIMTGSVINNTDKVLTSADISGNLQVIYKDKTIRSSENRDSGFKRTVSKTKPWNPQEKLEFSIKARNIEELYLQYDPEYVFFSVEISVEDPVGYSYNKAIEEYDLKDKWENLKK